ncbi:MAG: hypothetical protein ACR2QB_01920 [Gammaproteobacteria bacterium]
MSKSALSASVLMNVSELRIEDMRWSGSDVERQIVNRIFETSDSYGHWESFHAGLMSTVCVGASRKEQLVKMRRTRFTLIHQQSLFQYLRDSGVKGENRVAVIRAFHDSTDYMRAVVTEHGRFLRSNSSLFCADHLAYSVLHDIRFTDSLEHYRQKYMEYFSMHCNWIISEQKGAEYSTRRLIPETKLLLSRLQTKMLRMPMVVGEKSVRDRRPVNWKFWH